MNDRYMGRYRIPSARLRDYDYGSNGMYFITICTKHRRPYFGNLKENKMYPSPIGAITMQYWERIAGLWAFVELDAFQLMPDHVHGILAFRKPVPDSKPETNEIFSANENRVIPARGAFGPQRSNLASVIRGFKGAVQAYATTHGIPFGWQPRFHDRIIRTERELNAVRNYIRANPLKG